MYDPRLGRWGSIDRFFKKLSSVSPYNYALNSPILYFDYNGDFPFFIHARSFAPFDKFGGGFDGDGDNRKFTTSLSASYRIGASFTIESTTLQVTGSPYPAVHSGHTLGWDAESESYVDYSSTAMPLLFHNYGNNDAASEASSDIDVKGSITMMESLYAKGDIGDKVFSFTGSITGDGFPANETFVTDKHGNSVFLGTYSIATDYSISKEWLPMTELPGEGNKEMYDINVQIVFNSEGVIKGVINQTTGDLMSIDSWNKQFENKKPVIEHDVIKNQDGSVNRSKDGGRTWRTGEWIV